MTRLVNVVLSVALAFVAGLFCGVYPERITEGYRFINAQTAYQKSDPSGRHWIQPAKPSCGCKGCNGVCNGGQGQCQCDPLECMDKGGCFANCPGK